MNPPIATWAGTFTGTSDRRQPASTKGKLECKGIELDTLVVTFLTEQSYGTSGRS